MDEHNKNGIETIMSGKMTEENVPKKLKPIISASIFIAIIILVSILAYQKSQATDKKEYEKELKSVVVEIITESAKAENMIATYSKVWRTNIEMTLDEQRLASALGISTSEVRKYITKPNYSSYYAFKGDFNTAIKLTNEYFIKTGKIELLENAKSEISTKMRQLNNPPEEYVKAYEIAFELYSFYEEYVALAITPSGSLLTFNQKANSLSSDIIKKSKEFAVRIPIDE